MPRSKSRPTAPQVTSPKTRARHCHWLYRSATLAIAATCVSLAGCGPGDDDASVRNDLAQAYAYRAGGDEQRRYVQLADTAAAAEATAATSALANELVGDVSVELANAMLAGPIASSEGPQPGLVDAETDAIVLAEQATQLANVIALGQTYAEGQQQRNPDPLLQLVSQKMQDVREGEEWTPGGEAEAAIASIRRIDERLTQLRQQLEQLNGQIQQREDQRSGRLAEASRLDQQAEQMPLREGISTYRQVADLRTQAATDGTDVDRLEAQVIQTQGEIAEAEALRGTLEQTVGTLQSQHDSLTQMWQDVQAQIQQIQQVNARTYGQPGETPSGPTEQSVNALADQLAQQLARTNETRSEIVRLLEKAAGSYATAAGKARSASTRNEIFREAFTQALDANRMRLGQASANRQLGTVHLGAANVYAALVRLQNTLQDAQQPLPQAIGSDPTQAYRDSVTAAAAALEEADEALVELIGSIRSGPLVASAITQRAVLLSTMMSLNSLVEATGVETGAEIRSRQDIQSAMNSVAEVARTNSAMLPPVPGFAGAAGGEGPTTQPATGPAGTQPATEPSEDVEADEPAEGEMGDEGEAGEGAAEDGR